MKRRSNISKIVFLIGMFLVGIAASTSDSSMPMSKWLGLAIIGLVMMVTPSIIKHFRRLNLYQGRAKINRKWY